MKEYFEEYRSLVEGLKPVKDTSDLRAKRMMEMMGMEDKELFSQVEEVMNIDHLTTTEEVEPMQISDPINENIHGTAIPKFYKTNIPKTTTTKLKTLHLQDIWLNKSNPDTKGNRAAKQRRKRQSKHDNDNWFCAEKPPAQHKNWQMSDQATLFCVRVYRPFKHLAPHQYGVTIVKYSQEIWLLGTNTLADLRDRIWCPTDLNVVGSQQIDTVERPAVRAMDVYKSGFIYVEGTFYNDERHQGNIDYSEVIRNWAEDDPRRKNGPFSTGKMEDTPLDSLNIRLGYPYVYQHQGSHQHLVSFIDIRMLGPGDPQREADYPLLRSVGSQQSRYCMVCQTCIAVWVTMSTQKVPVEPYFFCGLCYKNFNFVDKKRVGSYTEFRYFDVNTI